MTKAISRLLGATATIAEISAAIEAARTDLSAAISTAEKAETGYQDGLLTESGAALRKLIDAKSDAQIEADRARAVIAKLEAQLETAAASEAEAGRQARYDTACDLAAKAKKSLADYTKAAIAIRDVLRTLAAADLAVLAANGDLPDGASALQRPEAERSTLPQYREVLSETPVQLWAAIGQQSVPLPDHLQRRVNVQRVGGRIRGRYADEDEAGDDGSIERGTVVTDGGGVIEVVKRTFIRREFLPDISGWHAASLASEIYLPALYAGASPLWTGNGGNAQAVLASLDMPIAPRPQISERTAVIEFTRA